MQVIRQSNRGDGDEDKDDGDADKDDDREDNEDDRRTDSNRMQIAWRSSRMGIGGG